MPLSSRATSSESEAFTAAAALCRKQSRSFYFATAFLPKEKRDAVCAIYSFCAMIRVALKTERSPGIQIPGRPLNVAFSENTLNLLRERLTDLYENNLELPNPQFRNEEQHALHAIQLTVNRYQISM